jgi:hypothetical protein
LRRHYANLSDQALLDIDRTDLVAVAQKCYDEEVARRGKAQPANTSERRTSHPANARLLDDLRETEIDPEGDGPEGPEWLEESACACTFPLLPKKDSIAAAKSAAKALEAAGIPSHLAVQEIAPIPSQREYLLMVPAKSRLVAESILQKEIFNETIEADWKTLFEELSDQELIALEPEILFGGLEDRIERLRRAYEEEFARRELEPPSYNGSS